MTQVNQNHTVGAQQWKNELRRCHRSRKTHAKEFLERPNAARPQLGSAHRSIWDWAVQAWMRSLTPEQSPVKLNLKKWGLTATAQCDCGHRDKFFSTLPPYSSSKDETNCAQQRGKSIWKSGETYQSRENTSSVGLKGPHLTHSANADNLKVSNHSTRSPKRKLDELLELFDDTTSSQRPDGLIEDTKLKHLFMIEVARTDDSLDFFLQAHVKNMCKYNPLLHAFPQHVVKQQS